MKIPPRGIEPLSSPPEGDTLSVELWGPRALL